MSQLTSSITKSLNKYSTNQAFTLKTLFAYHRYSYHDISTKIAQTISWLKSQNLKKGDRIVISSYNCPQYSYLLAACAYTGIIYVPIDYQASQTLIQKLITATKPKLLIKAQHKMITTAVPTVIIEHLDHLTNQHKTSLLTSAVNEDDVLEILYTSGTTGKPKGVVLTHQNVYSNIAAVSKVVDINQSFNTLSILPLSHIFEQVGMFALLTHGAHTTYMQSRRGSEISHLLTHESPNTLITVPAFLELFKGKILDKAKAQGKIDLLEKLQSIAPYLPQDLQRVVFFSIHKSLGGKLKRFIIGGAPLAIDTEIFWANLGVEIIKGYGLTETAPILTATPQNKPRLGAAGKPIPGVTISLDENQQILAKGPNIFKGYYKNPSATKKSFTKDGWFKTGDIGYLDQDGYLFIKSRLKNMIVKASGKNIYPEDIEVHYNKHSDIKEAIIVGIPHDNDQHVTAVILPVNTLSQSKANQITATINTHLESYQKVQKTIIWNKPDFPRTLTLKIKRAQVVNVLTQSKKISKEIDQDPLTTILTSLSPHPPKLITSSTLLTKDLGFDSLKIIELTVKIEETLKVNIPEHKLTPKTTVRNLRQLIKKSQSQSTTPLKLKSSMFSPALRPLKRSWPIPIRRITDKYTTPLTVHGEANLTNLPDQLIIVSNHTSHLDTPYIVSLLPNHLKETLSIAARYDYFFEDKTITQKLISIGFTHLGGAFPLVRDFNDQSHSVTESFTIAAAIIDRGWSMLIFPEGTRNSKDSLLPFKPGLGLLVHEFKLPVLPIRIKGLNHVFPKGASSLNNPHPVTISVGKLTHYTPIQSPNDITQDLQAIIQDL